MVGLLKLDAPESSLLDACQKLTCIMSETPEQKGHLIQQHGLMPLIEILEIDSKKVSTVLAVGSSASP